MLKNMTIAALLALVLTLAAPAWTEGEKGAWADSDRETLDLVRQAPAEKDFPGVSSAYLLTEEKDAVNEDGTAAYVIRVVWKILDKEAIPSGEVSIPFNSAVSTLEIDLARTITPDKTIVNVARDGIREVTPYSDFPMYANFKLKRFSMPALEVGSVVEYKATLRFFKPVMPGYFYSYWSFPAGRPVKLSIFEISHPAAMEGKYLARNTDLAPEITEQGARKTYRWIAKDVFIGGVFEPYLPPYDEACPNVIFVTMKSWKEISLWFCDMAEPKLEATDEMKNFAANVVKAKAGDREMIMKELYDHVSRNIRYVAMPLKSSDYRLHKAADIYRDKYGDCKDKSALLIALFRAAGIDANFALLRTRSDGSINTEFPAIDFTHCITAVPKSDGGYIFLDPTLGPNRFGYVPTNLRNVAIFIVKKDGYEFAKIPFEYEDSGGVKLDMEMRIRDDYAISIDERDEFSGDAEAVTRLNAKYSPPDAVRADIEKALQSVYTRPKLISFEFSEPDRLDEHFWMRSRYEVKDHIKEAGDLLIMDLPNPLILNMNQILGAERRTHPLWFPSLAKESAAITVFIPVTCRARYIPPNAEMDSPFGYYKREVFSDVDKIILKYYYRPKMFEIPVSQYEEFKKFAEGVVKSVKEGIVFEKRSPVEE